MKWYWQAAIAVVGVIFVFALSFTVVTSGTAFREAQNGEVQRDKWGSVQIWEDSERGVTCYTRTSPSGFSCVKVK